MLTLSDFAEAKGFSVEQLSTFGVRQNGRGLEIPYFTAEGAEYPRVRLRTAIAAKDGSEWSRGSAELIPYGLNRPVAWDKRYAFVVEGESDCWALWIAEKPAIGIPGATNMKCIRLELFDGADTLYVIREPGEAGSNFPHRVAQKLYDLGFAGSVYSVSLDGAKDPHELWKRDPAVFEEQLRTAVAARELMARPEKVKPRSSARSLTEILKAPRKPAEFLVEDLLPKSGIMLLAAKPKAGKSVLARAIARAVVTGTDFLGRACRKGKVLWLRLEEPYENFIDDLIAMGAAEWGDSFITNDDIPQRDLMGWLEQMVVEHEPTLVVIDTWAKLTKVRDINNYSEVNHANEPLMRLRERGIAQIWVHHAKKGEGSGSDDVLGTQALFGACDTLMQYKRMADDTRVLSTTQRVGGDMEETLIDLDPVTRLVSVNSTRLAARLAPIEDEILAMLAGRSEGSATKSELTESIKRRKSDVLAACDMLEERGIVSVERSDAAFQDRHVVALLSKNGSRSSATRFSETPIVTGSGNSGGSQNQTLFPVVPAVPERYGNPHAVASNSRRFPQFPKNGHAVPAAVPKPVYEGMVSGSQRFPIFTFGSLALASIPPWGNPMWYHPSYTTASSRRESTCTNPVIRVTTDDSNTSSDVRGSRVVAIATYRALRAERVRSFSPDCVCDQTHVDSDRGYRVGLTHGRGAAAGGGVQG